MSNQPPLKFILSTLRFILSAYFNRSSGFVYLIVIVGDAGGQAVGNGGVVPEWRRRDEGGRVAPVVVEVVATVDGHRSRRRNAKNNLESGKTRLAT